MARPPNRRPQGPLTRAAAGGPENFRRRASGKHRTEPAAPHGRARHRPHGLLAARVLHGPPHRRLRNVRRVGRHLQRTLLPGQPDLPRAFRARRHAPAIPRRGPGHLPSRTHPVRGRVRRRRSEPEPRPLRGPLDRTAAHRPVLVPHLRKDGRVRHPGHGARQHQHQPGFPHHRRPLPERGHHSLHAADPGRPVPRLPHPKAGH